LNNYPHPIIAREGWFYLGLVFAVTFVVQMLFGLVWSWPLWLITLFVMQFFRDPPRVVPVGDQYILSPADGRIVAVMACTDPYLQRPAIKISVFMNVFNVHSNRAPIAGTVRQITYQPGRFFNADLDKASTDNERNAIVLENARGQMLTCVQVAGLIARRILCYTNVGARLKPGQRYGFIRFGSRVDVYVPPESRVRAALGDKVSATTTILAEWNQT
jgi:phosphatidylserine decarboxylase